MFSFSPNQDQAARKLQRFFTSDYFSQLNQFSTSYTRFENAYGINIAKLSRRNFKKLIAALKNREAVPASEHAFYGKLMLNSAELALFRTWQEKVVPQITLKHAVPHLDFAALIPQAERDRQSETVNNSHTRDHALKENVFFVLGVGDEHQTPNFLGKNNDVVLVRLGQMDTQAQYNMRGLWLSGHFDEYLRSEELPPLLLGTTKRCIQFKGGELSKTYCYERADGTVITRTVSYQDEVFAADANLASLFEALFYQLMLELRYIGAEFQQQLLAEPENAQLLGKAFNLLFNSWVYPEAKLPRKLALNQAYVEVLKKDSNYLLHLNRLYCGAKKGDIKALQACIDEKIPLEICGDFSQTPLLIALEKKQEAAALFLLEQGASITWPDDQHEAALIYAIRGQLLEVIDKIIAGIPLPLPVSNILARQMVSFKTEEPLLEAFKTRNPEIIAHILQQYPSLPEDNTVILACYKLKMNLSQYLDELLDKGARIDAADGLGYTALLWGSAQGDNEAIKMLLARGANLHCQVLGPLTGAIGFDEGKTALHMAAQCGQLATVEMLMSQGMDPKAQDFRGNTAYACAIEALAQDINGYKDREFRYHLFSHFVVHDKQQESWQIQKQGLQDVIDYFEQQYGMQNIAVDKTPLQCCNTRKFATAILLTCEFAQETYVLLARKADNMGKPQGFYLAPGGLIDKEDVNVEAAAVRELYEETGILLPASALQHLQSHSIIDAAQATLMELVFFSYSMGEVKQLPALRAKSDIAEARWVKCSAIEVKSGYFYQGCRIQHSNALLLAGLLGQTSFDKQQVEQTLRLELLNGEKMLLQGIYENDLDAIHMLAQEGLDFAKTSALNYACALDANHAVIDTLIGYGANVDKVNSNTKYQTPLLTCMALKNTELAKYLIERHHANINLCLNARLPGDNASSALIYACAYGLTEFASYLLSEKAASLSQGIGGAAMMQCIYNGHEAMLELLLQKATIDLNQPYGTLASTDINLPLWLAIVHGSDLSVKLLLAYGAHPTVMCKRNYLEHTSYGPDQEYYTPQDYFTALNKYAQSLQETLTDDQEKIEFWQDVLRVKKGLAPVGEDELGELEYFLKSASFSNIDEKFIHTRIEEYHLSMIQEQHQLSLLDAIRTKQSLFEARVTFKQNLSM